MMEDKVSKQILSAFADSRLNTAHLAWLVKAHTSPQIDNMLKEFFYYYTVFYNNATQDNDAAWMGEKFMDKLQNPIYNSLSSPPPPGTRVVFAD